MNVCISLSVCLLFQVDKIMNQAKAALHERNYEVKSMKNNKRMTNWGIVTMICSLVLLLFLSTLSLLETQTNIKNMYILFEKYRNLK